MDRLLQSVRPCAIFRDKGNLSVRQTTVFDGPEWLPLGDRRELDAAVCYYLFSGTGPHEGIR
jgi:hypothetical protein